MALLEAACYAPSCSNEQPLAFLGRRQREKADQAAQCIG